MKQSLRDRILAYYQRHAGTFISGGEIERLVAQNTKYKASNASRRLRELREDGLLEAKGIKGTVFYRYVPHEEDRTVVEVIGNVAYKRIEKVMV